MKATMLAGLMLCLSTSAIAGEGAIVFRARPEVSRAGDKVTITFAVDKATDIEVAILDAKGKVVRHLAAGVVGGKTAPPAPLKPGLSQSLEWDGKDDYAEAAKGGPFKARVRLGMGVKLENIVGGDPYAFWSPYCHQGDHSKTRLTGLEIKSDGNVYIIGNATPYGVPTVRQYSTTGEYIKTVFPPPAGKAIADVKGWGVNIRADGTYTYKSSRQWQFPALSTTLMSPHPGLCAGLVPSPEEKTLSLVDLPSGWDDAPHYGFLAIGTDGTLRTNQPRPMFGDVKLPGGNKLIGPFFSALTPDRKALYVSGLFSVKRKSRWQSPQSAETTGFWRDGQVWKLDLATRKLSVFFALDEKTVVTDKKSRGGAIGHTSTSPCAALHGVAVDAEGRVFVCDRQNRRIVVLDKNGKLIREIPNVAHPDAIGVSPKSKALYVTTRVGNYHRKGKLKLLKFNDWSKNSAPAVTMVLSTSVGAFPYNSFLAVAQDKGEVAVWVAYVSLPARVYRDTGTGLKLIKDFYESGIRQRPLDLQHMEVDKKTGDVYFSNAWGWLHKVTDWKDPKFVLCRTSAKKRLFASSIGIDARNRFLFTHFHHTQGVYRYKMDGEYYTPAPVGGAGHQITPRIVCSWIMSGLGERGIAAAPGGGLATLGAVPGGKVRTDDYSGRLNFWNPNPTKAPWDPVLFGGLAKKPFTGGVRFDLRGNVYAGVLAGKVHNVPSGFKKDQGFLRTTGRIYKYEPTGLRPGKAGLRPGAAGSPKDGKLFPTAPAAPAKIYDVHYGPISRNRSRTPRFGIDGYGRIYYPTGPLARVSVIDNEGNDIFHFGTYGNRDSMGCLKGDLVPTKDVPMILPNSVDATDDYIYVSDIMNVRLLRLRKTFAASETVEVE